METNNNFSSTTDNGKMAAIISYFGIVLWLVAYFAIHKDKKTELGSYQLRQTLLFAIVSTILYFVLSFILGLLIVTTGIYALVYISYIVYIVLLVIWLIGLIGAINGEKKPMPIIGERAQTMFPSI